MNETIINIIDDVDKETTPEDPQTETPDVEKNEEFPRPSVEIGSGRVDIDDSRHGSNY